MKHTLLALSLLTVGLTGCSLLGPNATAPGKVEGMFETISNTPMVTTVAKTVVTYVTNEIPREVLVPRYETVTVTNALEQAVTVTNTLTVTNTVLEKQIVQVTNVVPAGTSVLVPQITGLSGAGQAVAGATNGVAGILGWGSVATLVLSGFGHWYQNRRNQALAAAAGVMSGQASAASTAVAALQQSEQVLVQVLQQTPQGQQLLPVVQNFLSQHKLEEGVAEQLAALVEQNVNVPEAQVAAATLLDAAKRLVPSSDASKGLVPARA